MSDGTRWKVTRKRSTVPIVKKKGQLAPGVGWDASKVWLKVSWCQGTRGEIRVGGNPQGAAADLLKTLAQGIADGGDAPSLKTLIITAPSITPFVDWDIQRPGDWRITGEVTLTFDKEGLKTAGGKLSVKKGPFEGGVEGTGDRDGKWNITLQGKYTPGGKTKTDGPCPLDELYFPYEYECEHEWDVAPTVKKTPMSEEKKIPAHRFVYFKYASDEINPQLTSKDDLKAVEDLKAAGYAVVNIQAFTSPEGLRDPSPRWKEGNKALSMRRAKKAQELAGDGPVSEPKDVELLPLDFENLERDQERGPGQGARGQRHLAVGVGPRRGRAEDPGGREARGLRERPAREGRGHLRVPAASADRPREDREARVGPGDARAGPSGVREGQLPARRARRRQDRLGLDRPVAPGGCP